MPYKRRRGSYRRRFRSRLTRRFRRFGRLYRKNARRRKYTSRRVRRFGRLYRRYKRRRGIIRKGIVASGAQVPIYKQRKTYRRDKLGKRLGRKIDDFLGSKFKMFDTGTDIYEESSAGDVAGTFIPFWVPTNVLKDYEQHALQQDSRTYSQGGYTSVVKNGEFLNYQGRTLSYHSFSWRFKVTNNTNTPVRVRFSTWKAKRDIPAIFTINPANPSAATQTHPIRVLYERIIAPAGGLSQEEAEGLLQAALGGYNYTTDQGVYDYDVMKVTKSYKPINYYFKFRVMKECRIEPGAYSIFTFAYTPKMKQNWNMWLPYMTRPQWNGLQSTAPVNGIAIWKGLNDQGPLIEFKGIATTRVDETTPIVGTSPSQLVVEQYFMANFTLSPHHFREHTNKSYSTGDEVDPLGLHADETIPTRVTTVTI